jgi:hypothetical protein
MTGWGAVRGRYRVAADPLRTERKVELVAVILGLLLCLQLLYSGARLAMAPAFDAVVPAEDVLLVKRVDHPATVTSSQSDEIRARPLFWPARRPEQESMAEVAPDVGGEKAGQVKSVKLLGVFGSGDMAGIIALVKGKKRRILQGESVAGWMLEVVQPNRVVLVNGGRREELVLKTGIVIAAADTGVANSGAGRPVADRKKPAANGGERRLSPGGGARAGGSSGR